MPNNLLTADTNFPELDDKQTADEKLTQVVNYLYMLLEQLRYTLANLGKDNFNSTELEKIANVITEPIYLQLADDEGNISALVTRADELYSRIQGAEGNISELTQTATALETSVTGAQGDISALRQRADSVESRVQTAEGGISSILQTGAGVQLSVANGEKSSQLTLTANGTTLSSQTVRFTGNVVFQSDLAIAGRTVIDAGNITTGMISADRISTNIAHVNDTLYLGDVASSGKGIIFSSTAAIVNPEYTDGLDISAMGDIVIDPGSLGSVKIYVGGAGSYWEISSSGIFWKDSAGTIKKTVVLQ